MIGFGDIEQAIKDTCDDLKKSGQWDWLKTVASYGGEFDDDLLNIVGHFPAIWVTITGDKPEKIGHGKYKYFAKVAIIVGASSNRNEEAGRHGAGSDIGSYEMLKAVLERFTETTLSDKVEGLSSFELGRCKTLFNTITKRNSMSAIAQEFRTSFIIKASDRDREEEDAEYIHKIHTDYYYQPSEKTPEDEADASDVIHLKE